MSERQFDDLPPENAPLRRWVIDLSLLNKSRLLFGVLMTAFLFTCGTFFLLQNNERDSRAWTVHTYEVLATAERVETHLLDSRHLLRDGLLTVDPTRLQAYEAESEKLRQTIEDLRALTRDNPVQQGRLEQLDELLGQWTGSFVQPSLSLLRRSDELRGQLADPQFLQFITGSTASLEPMQRVLADFKQDERGLLGVREKSMARATLGGRVSMITLLLISIVSAAYALLAVRFLLTIPLARLTDLIPRMSEGDFALRIPYGWRRDEVGKIARALSQLVALAVQRRDDNWVKTRSGELSGRLQLAENHAQFGDALLRSLCVMVDAGYGVAYRWDEDQAELRACASYGLPLSSVENARFSAGQGPAGQCLIETFPLTLSPVPAEHFQMVSGLGTLSPDTLVFVPLISRGENVGVIELATLKPLPSNQMRLLREIQAPTALAWQTLARSQKTRELLGVTQAQAEALQKSGEALRTQAEELHRSNEALREKTTILGNRQIELEAVRSELERRADELERASRYKSEFLANMSHELRTPLNSLLILSKGLAADEDRNLLPEQIESARIVHESGQSLLQLINDILDLSKVEAGHMQIHTVDVDLAEFVALQERNFRHVARSRDLEFTVSLAPDLPATIRTDDGRLGQVVVNLLSNAFKFTHSGSVTLSIARPPGLLPEHALSIMVTDTGIGIPPDRLVAIFKPFEQVDSGTSRRFGGTGLGLSIVNGMIRLLGGEVLVHSTPGAGSTFTLIIPEVLEAQDLVLPTDPGVPAFEPVTHPSQSPAVAGTAGGMLPAESPESNRDLGGRHVLIVDDDMRNLFALSKSLRAHRLEVSMAQDGFKALSLLEAAPRIDLVLMDITMPGIDGYETIRRIREREQWRRLPIIAVTANAMTGDRELCLDAGASDYCTKPIDIGQLVSLIRTWL